MDDEKKPSLADRINAARAQAEHAEIEADRGDSFDQGRQTRAEIMRDHYRYEIASRAPQQAPVASEHKADLVPPFQSFEVQHVIEVKGPDGKPNEIWERAGFEGTYGDTGMITGLSMRIDEIRRRSDFVAEKWAVIGHGSDIGPTMIGAYEDLKTARDVLGGITGDRFYDQRPLTQTAEAALWHGFAQAIDSLPFERQSLADRIGVNHSDAAENLAEARRKADRVVRDELASRLPPPSPELQGTNHYTQDQHLAATEYFDRTENRPNEQLLGRTRSQRW